MLWFAALIVLGIIVGVPLLYVIYTYNRLAVLTNRCENGASQIDVQLKKRADLVPNLVETVKGYAKHEKGTFEAVTNARAQLVNAKGIESQAKANNMLSSALKSLFAVSERYPQLKANQNFAMLQEELSGIENKIAYARQFYNDTALVLDNKISVFPSNIIAKIFNYKQKPYFEAEGEAKKAVKVQF